MEGKPNPARKILDDSPKFATARVTNENRVRYLVSCLWVALTLCLIYLTWMRWNLTFSTLSEGQTVGLAAIAGALGAVFSIATRIQDLELHPCRQSMMNYFMGGLRVITGFSAGAVIMLITSGTILGNAITPFFEGPYAAPTLWRGFVLLGFLGGFAERVVPLLLGKLEGRVEGSSVDKHSEATGEVAAPAAPADCGRGN